jgi:hypothetical protein
MRFMKARSPIIISVCLFGLFFKSFSQGAPQMPQLLPPSPEPAAMAKANNMDVSLSSGMANVSIPIHELKVGKNSLPVSLNYSSNGFKVDEIPSRAGNGWILNAGGVITRSVQGKPDEKSIRRGPPAGNPTLNDLIYYYDQLSSTANSTFDNEPDIYMISAPGLSGKFIVDSTGQAVKIPYNNYKINVTATSSPYTLKVDITDMNGVIYYFGYNNMVEKTVSHNLQGKYVVHQSVITAMFLTKIAYPDGTYVTFSYSPVSYRTISGFSQSLGGAYYESYQQLCQCTGSLQPNQCGSPTNSVTTDITDVVYDSYYLTGIITSDFRSISFAYDNRPDNSGDKRFNMVTITDGSFSRQYRFTYDDPATGAGPYSHAMGSYNKRFFLKELYWLITVSDAGVFDTIRYNFNYESLNSLPPRLDPSQDHLGYYNGASNPYLLPQMPNNDSVNWGSQYAVANREPNANSAKAGMLSRVTYPTGGYQEFEYEGNVYSNYIQLNSATDTKYITGSGNTNGSGQYTSQVYYSQIFNILQTQTCNLSLSVYANPGCSNCTPPPPNTVTLAKIEVFNTSTNTVVFSNIERSYTTTNFSVSLTAGNNYRLQLTAWGLPNAATAEIRYDPASGPVYGWVNYNAPGLRVKKITSFDPVSSKSTYRHFIYKTNPADVQSSASYLMQPDYLATTHVKVFCESDLPPNDLAACKSAYGVPAWQAAKCKSISLLSNTTMVNFTFDNNHILYNTVIETDDLALVNGYVQHKYWVYPIFNSTVLRGYKSNNVPGSTNTNLNGYEKETNYYNKSSALLKQTFNYYTYDAVDFSSVVSALTVRKKYPIVVSNTDPEYMLDPYDITQYDFTSYWIQLDSTINIDYDVNSNVLKAKTTYYYGASANTQPIKTEAANSTGELITTDMKYPNDYAVTPYTTMVTKNIISPVIETKQKRGTADISLIRNNYKQWYSSANSIIIEPEYITAKKGTNAEETRIRYHTYDETGNPLEVSKENGSRISYIWDYGKNFPIAEFKNASFLTDSIAYTSFEADGKGYWNFIGTPVQESGTATGTYAYNLTSGNITRTSNSAKTYFVTYWLKNSSGSVNVNSIASKTLINRNGWTCYEHLVTNPSTITISGTGKIDELRLYPVGTYVTTFTYWTYVGISSRNEPNNQISYYEYDGGLRLKLVRDGDRNIVKQYDYQYKKQIYPCSNTTANWVVTGVLRCVKTADHTNNNTGVQEREEKDFNNCSPTYLQTHWVSLGVNGQCPPVANCTGPDKRVINGVCSTGWKLLVNSYQTGPNSWVCTYRYVWNDGYAGANFDETSSTGCGGSGGPE